VPLVKPVEKKLDVPVLEVAQKAKKVNRETQRRQEPVQMMPQTTITSNTANSSEKTKD